MSRWVCLCWCHGSAKSTQTRPMVIQIHLFTSCIHQFFVCCVLWIFLYCMPSSLLWSATWVDKKGLSLPPWDCPLYSTGKVLLFIHMMYPCFCSLSLCFLFSVIVAKLFLSPSVTQSFSSYRLRHTANK